MDTSICKFENDEGREISFTADDVHQLVNPNASPKDVALFMAFCQAHKLDPIGTKDAYLVGYNGRNGYQTSIITSYHVFNKLACAHDSYDGIESGVVTVDSAGQLHERTGALVPPGESVYGGWARVYDKRRSHPFTAMVAFGDYNTGLSQWKSRPAMMIEKVAKCQAWRGMYPEMRDMYSSEEMGRATAQASAPAPAAAYAIVQPAAGEPDAEETPDAVDCEPEEPIIEPEAPVTSYRPIDDVMVLAQQFADAKGRSVNEVLDALARSKPMAPYGGIALEDLDAEGLFIAKQVVSGWVATTK